ncbi:MAG: aldo/keto reductase [Desulfobacteraceae bacterium]|nr:aldo/keto reductase [Desulfobacteraceae bacterium]MBU4055199.1 aldo/keto reductase [Pseudomonadota bacterium]
MIEKLPFGKTGHLSTRIIFGAAALGAMRQDRGDRVLETLVEFGINHIDVAASYGDAELRVGPWMKKHRDHFFLATKTGERTAQGTMESIHRSLERLETNFVDLIQFHNLTDDSGWETALGPKGALEAAVQARKQGLVKHIGVTGHGTMAPRMHMKSLNHFDFDSVLLPYNFMLMQNPEYAEDFFSLKKICSDRGIAMQTIKSIARRRWKAEDPSKRFSWYEPVKDPEVIQKMVHWVLDQPGIFLNTSSDATLLPLILKAAAEYDSTKRSPGIKSDLVNRLKEDAGAMEMEPIFIRGIADGV